MNKIGLAGKFLDQPMLVAKLQKSVPYLLAASSVGYTGVKTVNAPNGEKKKTAISTGITLGAVAASAVAAPHIASRVSNRPLNKSFETIKKETTDLVDKFVKNNTLDNETTRILNKSKEEVLNRKEIEIIYNKLSDNENGKKFLNKLIPMPKNESAKELFSQIGYLSVYGAMPVIGGIAGGICADKVVDKQHWKQNIPNKIKEGAYQYLANIFLCNVGAGAALAVLEKSGIKSKAARALGMTTGIIATGIIGGNKIANYLGRNFIDPLFNDQSKKHIKNIHFKKNTDNKKDERTPELLDIGLHTDDIATVSLLSGLKWIEPALPLMYAVSGYRAGIGYRN